MNNNNEKRTQWIQLASLSLAHIIIDIFAGLLAVIMPAVQKRFSISMVMGITLLSVLNITTNFIQVLTGHLRENQTKPMFLPAGLIMIISICFIAAVPIGPVSVWLCMVLIIITALGSGIAHPESLRALHTIDRIPPSMSTSIFLVAGYFGYASGGWLAALLITIFGFNGLYLLIILPFIAILAIFLSKIHLVVEDHEHSENYNRYNIDRIGFIPVMLMAIPATTVTAVLCALLPQKLHQMGFELTFGGLTVMTLVGGSIFGAFFWSFVSQKKGELLSAVIALLSGIPFLYFYLFMMDSRVAVWFLFVAGFGSGSAYPLIVTLARYAKGFNLGRRMGFVVGGAWGIASLILWALGPVAEYYGVLRVLLILPLLYLISAMIGIAMLMKRK